MAAIFLPRLVPQASPYSSYPLCHMLVVSCLLFLLDVLPVSASGGLFTYYETPLFYRNGNKGSIMAKSPNVGVGPSQWRNLLFPHEVAPMGNQCAGIGQQTGFGQSPIAVPRASTAKCQTDMTGYKFEGGTCTWSDLSFDITTTGLSVGVKPNAHCTLGRMKIPNKRNWFSATRLQVHTGSEHSIGGKYSAAELQLVHQESSAGSNSKAILSMFLDAASTQDNGVEQDTLEHFLKGWEATARQSQEFCAVYPSGNGYWHGESILESRQMRIECPAVGFGVVPDQVQFEQSQEASSHSTTTSSTHHHNEEGNGIWNRRHLASSASSGGGMPINRLAEYLEEDIDETIPNLYQTLSSASGDFGVYTYRGGLTTPPCTENVYWNLVDKPVLANTEQIERLYELALCYLELSTCRYATVANEDGLTKRPVQPLMGRIVTHRCPTSNNSNNNSTTNNNNNYLQASATGEPIPDPIPPAFEYVDHQASQCVLGGNGGPLGICWEGHLHNHFAMLFPWFVMALGLITFYLLTRYAHWFPYTASMFLLGIFMGVGIVRLDNTDQLSASIRMWENIDAETLFLAFLPGLLFRDSYCSNVFLFAKALPQSVLLAFPGVLVGTCLTACVGYYILPYGWSWSFCMMFGSILSATDPVAVAALLGEVGAPPRLQTHIAGESMLNDGSAIVFFTIFSQIFLSELNIPGVGTEIGWGDGFALFFRMSLGAVVVGAAFALALLTLVYMLNRRFNHHESVVQVVATITTAYLSYYVAEAVFGMSGVIAVVTCGIMTKFCASSIFNDPAMMDKFWITVEHILNSLIFCLGGVVWGTVISQEDPDRPDFKFGGKDWGYLFLVYILVMLVRLVLIFGFYPLFSQCGLGSNWREALFMVWGGLRGAVGIALAIAFDKEIQHDLYLGDPRRNYSSQLFAISGGIAFLTLVINGTLAGPILNGLGLADIGDARKKVVERYREVITSRMLCDLVKHLGHSRFSGVDYAVVKNHITFFADVSPVQIRYAVKHNKEFSSLLLYKEPNLTTMKPFMNEEDYDDIVSTARINTAARLRSVISMASIASMSSRASLAALDSSEANQPTIAESARHLAEFLEKDEVNHEDAVELRKVFVELLRSAYEEQFDSGEIDVRDGLLVYAIKSSIETSADLVSQGHRLDDWYAVTKAATIVDADSFAACTKQPPLKEGWSKLRLKRFTETKALVRRAIAFIEAHHRAQKAFKNDYCNGQMLSETEVLIIDESEQQVKEAEHSLKACYKEDVTKCVAHVLCSILLSRAADVVGNLTHEGLLREQEAEEYLHIIEHDMEAIERSYDYEPKASNAEGVSTEEESYSGHSKQASSLAAIGKRLSVNSLRKLMAKSKKHPSGSTGGSMGGSTGRLGSSNSNLEVIESEQGELSEDSDLESDIEVPISKKPKSSPKAGMDNSVESFAQTGMAMLFKLNSTRPAQTPPAAEDDYFVGMSLDMSEQESEDGGFTPFGSAPPMTTQGVLGDKAPPAAILNTDKDDLSV